ncbi:protein of unknown function [Streptomyces sp. KY70]|nr:protein of unknown function [Streptomyces sp. KY70]
MLAVGLLEGGLVGAQRGELGRLQPFLGLVAGVRGGGLLRLRRGVGRPGGAGRLGRVRCRGGRRGVRLRLGRLREQRDAHRPGQSQGQNGTHTAADECGSHVVSSHEGSEARACVTDGMHRAWGRGCCRAVLSAGRNGVDFRS